MHIPDGFLDTKTIIATSLLSGYGVASAYRSVRKTLIPRQIPLMGLAAAFVFVAQMLNFPVIGGTSGHLIGSVLTAVLLGPGAAILVIASVIVVQCFLFADGGILALGANILNMAVVGSLSGYGMYRLISGIFRGETGRFVGIGFGSWFSTIIVSVICSGELVWSGMAEWGAAFPVVTGIHIFIGIGEGVITTLVVAAVWKKRPDLSDSTGGTVDRPGLKDFFAYTLIVILSLILFVSPFVSEWPDGLERAASLLGFEQSTVSRPVFPSPIFDYRIPGIGSPVFAIWIAGLIGASAAFAISFILARAIILRQKKELSWKPYKKL